MMMMHISPKFRIRTQTHAQCIKHIIRFQYVCSYGINQIQLLLSEVSGMHSAFILTIYRSMQKKQNNTKKFIYNEEWKISYYRRNGPLKHFRFNGLFLFCLYILFCRAPVKTLKYEMYIGR